MDAARLLASVPTGLRTPLVERFREIGKNFYEGRWAASELDGGKFCEVAYWIVHGALSGTYEASPTKPSNLHKKCQELENLSTTSGRVGDRSLRVHIPRALSVLYEFRNNRDAAHIGGEVNANFMDASAVFSLASWIMAELVRVFHLTTTEQAQRAVDALIERRHPLIWENGSMRRVLDAGMPKADQVLALLYGQESGASESDLITWTEYSNASVFRAKILEPLHKTRKIEYDRKERKVLITPLGGADVERRVLPKLKLL
jgi:hypothetical protein